MSYAMREGYEIYFQIKPGNREKYWIPNSCCSTCAVLLRSVYRGDFDHLFRFTSSTSWREPQNHIDDFYFYLTDFKGYSSKWKDSIIYHNVSSVTKTTCNRKDSISRNFTKLMKQMLIIVEHARGKVSDYKQQFEFIFQQKLTTNDKEWIFRRYSTIPAIFLLENGFLSGYKQSWTRFLQMGPAQGFIRS